ncbi:MAG: transposase [Caldilineaceae bacterium]
MPARQLEFAPGCYYHLYNRGAHRMSLFRCPDNYLFVLERMKKYAAELQLTIIAYCLLPNHYHWLLRQDGDQPAGMLAQRVFNSYSKAYNKAYQHIGTLFETRYKGILVDSDEYLRHLCCYIHANPVLHGIADTVELWPYSNYPEWIGMRNGTIIDRTFVEALFPHPDHYRAMVHNYITGRHKFPLGLQSYLASLE